MASGTRISFAAVIAAAAIASPAQAVSPVPIQFGTTWDAPTNTLQNIVNAYLGSPGLLNVTTDYIGAQAGQPDAIFWIDDKFPALLIREVAGYSPTNVLGWYNENFFFPVIDGVGDGIVFNGSAGAGASTVVVLPGGVQNFGFYLNPNGSGGSQNAPEPEKFFTNRFYNDKGPNGAAAIHVPYDGDVQAIVFDVSQWKGPNTYLICFEDLDSGATVGPCCTGSDNDFNDFVFEIQALAGTPATKLTFGSLKATYRK